MLNQVIVLLLGTVTHFCLTLLHLGEAFLTLFQHCLNACLHLLLALLASQFSLCLAILTLLVSIDPLRIASCLCCLLARIHGAPYRRFRSLLLHAVHQCVLLLALCLHLCLTRNTHLLHFCLTCGANLLHLCLTLVALFLHFCLALATHLLGLTHILVVLFTIGANTFFHRAGCCGGFRCRGLCRCDLCGRRFCGRRFCGIRSLGYRADHCGY